MAYCRNCGMPIDEKKDIRCPRCGEFTDKPISESRKKDTNKTLIVVLLSVIVLVCLFCITFVLVINKDTEPPVEEASPESVTTVIVQNNQNIVQNVEGTQPHNEIYNNTQVPQANSSQASYSFISGKDGFVSYNTPGHAGVNLRANNDAGSRVLVTLPEGTWVTLVETTTVFGDSYVGVSVNLDGKYYTGYILAKYISGVGGIGDDGRGDEPDDGARNDSDGSSGYYISYNTPEDKGVNIRSKASSYSDLIVTLPEGTDLVFAELHDANDYCFVGAYLNGQYYEGYVLTKYID